MKPRLALSTKILLLASGNLLLLALAFVVFARFELHMQLDSFLFGGQDRVVSLARQATLDLEDTPAQSRDALLDRYRRIYKVDFYLYVVPAVQIAGPAVELPRAVLNEIHKPPARGEGPPGGFGRGREDGEVLRDGAGGDGSGRDGPPLFEVSTADPAGYWAGARIPIREPGQDFQTPGILLMHARSFLGTPLFFDYRPWLAISTAVVLAFLFCWLPFIRGLTHAVSQMSRVTGQIAEGHFDQHLPEDRRDELGLLAAGINRMASRLSGFVHGQKRFLGDIAHELCAPISRIQFALGVLERRIEPGAVDDLQEEVRQMSTLVAELLSFSKAGLQAAARPLVPVDIAGVVDEAVSRENAAVEVTVEPGISAMADPDSLSRAVANLVRNALRYAGSAGPVALTARREANDVVITIADHGPGIPEEEIDRVFAPFYRVESSRDRASGGVGLGLAIVRNCVDACRGTVRCRNRVPTGLEVEIRLAAAGHA